MFDEIFTAGWLINVLLFGLVFLLAQHVVYQIIFRSLVGSPKSYYYKDLVHWQRKASFLGAVVFAPLFEEWMFTYLAYASFLRYATPGQEGWVIFFVGLFFALLHFPGDFQRMGRRLTPWILYRLFKFQLDRLFFSLTAFFIYQLTGQLVVTILLHYLINGIVSVYNFDLEDSGWAPDKGDGRLILIRLINISLALSATYFMYTSYPLVGLSLLPFAIFSISDYIYWHRKTTSTGAP